MENIDKFYDNLELENFSQNFYYFMIDDNEMFWYVLVIIIQGKNI